MKSKIAIVTGASGLVGKACVLKLKQQNFEVISISKDSIDATFRLDLSKEFVHDSIDINKIDLIVHCAALIPNEKNTFSICKSINEKINFNLSTTLNKNTQIHLIFISTTNFYKFENIIITENSEVHPFNEYALEKKNAEDFFLSLDNKITVLRINAPYHFSMVTNTVLKIFINKALNNDDITYYGSGNRTQDFTHVDDIANAVFLASLYFEEKSIFNIASGDAISMINLAKTIKNNIPNCTSTIVKLNKEDSLENFRASFDLSNAKEFLKWSPDYTILKGIKEWINNIK